MSYNLINTPFSFVSYLDKIFNLEISRLGNILVDGKPYPPQPSPPPQQQQRQQPSPNMAPPLRPGMPPGMQAGMSPGVPPPPAGFGPQNGPGLYNSSSPQQHVHNMQMNRNFAAEGPGKGRQQNRSKKQTLLVFLLKLNPFCNQIYTIFFVTIHSTLWGFTSFISNAKARAASCKFLDTSTKYG